MKNNEYIKKESLSFRQWKKRRRITLVIIAVCAIILSAALGVAVGLSWQGEIDVGDVPVQEVGRTVTVTDFSVSAIMSIGDESYVTDINTVMIPKTNYSDLRIDLEYVGESHAYIRVKFFESFCDKDGKQIIKSDVNYLVNEENWVYYPEDDCYYYKWIVGGGTENKPVSIPFVTGGVTVPNEKIEYASTDGFKLDMIIEEAQPDRFAEFFGVEPDVVFG